MARASAGATIVKKHSSSSILTAYLPVYQEPGIKEPARAGSKENGDYV